MPLPSSRAPAARALQLSPLERFTIACASPAADRMVGRACIVLVVLIYAWIFGTVIRWALS